MTTNSTGIRNSRFSPTGASKAKTLQVLLISAMFFSSLVLGGCSRKKQEIDAAAVQAVRVDAAPSEGRMVPISLSETGSFLADEASNVAPPVAGRILKTPVSVGAFVKAGQALAELDHRDAELKLVQMKAQLAEATAGVRQAQSRIGLETGSFDPAKVPEVAGARANFESAEAESRLAAADAKRYANLVTSGDVSQSVYDKARTQADTAAAKASASRQQYEAALNAARQSYQAVSSSQASLDAVRAQVSQAEKGLADTTIRAPFDGYVSARPVAVGEYVAATNTVATVVRIDVLKLQLQTPEKSAAGLKVSMPVVARVAAYPNRDFQGTTSAVNPAINPDSRAFVLEARFINTDALLRPGMFATAKVVLPGEEKAVFVPKVAVVRDRTTDSNQVYVLEGGKAHLRVVVLGEANDTSVRILSGIAQGELVALNKQSELYDGAIVDVRTKR
jgi:multidrug efflux pump subunit AcrA (membrane-fusion protein)